MPYPDGRIVERLLEHRDGFDAVVPRTPEGYEPVFALYHQNCLPQMEAMLRQNRFRIYDFYQCIRIRYLDPPELPEGWQRSLTNVNTPRIWPASRRDDPARCFGRGRTAVCEFRVRSAVRRQCRVRGGHSLHGKARGENDKGVTPW